MISLDENELAVLVRLRKKALATPYRDDQFVNVTVGVRALAIGLTYGNRKWNLSISPVSGRLSDGKAENARAVAKVLGAPAMPMMTSPKGVMHWAWYTTAGVETEDETLPTEVAADGRWEVVAVEPNGTRNTIGRCPDREEATGVFMIDVHHRKTPATYFAIDHDTGQEHRMGEIKGPKPRKEDAQ
jgi:hypothetical protein